MNRPIASKGFTLIELLMVLVIVGVLAFVGVRSLGNSPANAVRSVTDELEAMLYTAQRDAAATSSDIFISVAGDWTAGTLILDGRPLNSLVFPGGPPVNPTGDILRAGVDAERIGPTSACFRARITRDGDHQKAGVATTNTWYTTALNGAPDLKTVPAIASQADFVTALDQPLFKGGTGLVVVNGLTRRFTTGFSIVVVGLRGGQPVPGGPIGVLVAPRNSSSVYKYYKASGETTWRRM